MNRSKDLKELFRLSLNESSIKKSSSSLRIYFYEWSNVCDLPRTFNNLEDFELFLKSCDIRLESYQREIINSSGVVYISCYTGVKLLSICDSWRSLYNSINGVKTPYPSFNVGFNVDGLGFKNNGTFFG